MRLHSNRLCALFLGALVGLAGSGCGGRGAPRGLLLVTIDTCRADRIGCYGARGVETPAIDSLAERGVVFLEACAPVPLTLPSHCSILTGLYPDRHGVRDNGAGPLPEKAVTLAEILRERAWRTAAFVSAFPLERSFGSDQGFDVYDDQFTGTAAGPAAHAGGEAEEVAERLFYDERVAREVVDSAVPWLREAVRGEEPFFLWVHFFDPHAVYAPPPHLARRYGFDSYEGEIAFVDEEIARLLAEIKPISDRVTVVVTADHGESLGEHEESTHGLFVYQSTLRVPWVLAGPGLPEGVRLREPVSLVQLLPTVLDHLGIEPPEGLDGASALPLVRGRGETSPAPVFSECLFPRLHFGWAALRSVRAGRWKLIDAPRPELYDLAADPGERENLVERRPELVRELREILRRHAERGGALGEERIEIDEEVREKLERLGYVGGGALASGQEQGDELWSRQARDPKDMVGFFNRLQEVPTLMMSGRREEASRTLRELHETDPSNTNVLEKLALLHRLDEDWAQARDWCRAYLKLVPEDTKMRMNLAFALSRLGDREGARAAYREVLAREPKNADAWGLLGSLLAEDGGGEEALRAFRRAVELAPEDAELHAGLARVREKMGDVEGALSEYDRALVLDGGFSSAVNGKALLLWHGGRVEEALEVLRGSLEELSEDVETRNNLAWILTQEGVDASEGYEHARKAYSLAPEDPAVEDTYGWAAVRSGRAGEAVEVLRRAWEATGDAEVRAHLGVALISSGREGEGREHLRAAVAERPSLEELPEVRAGLER